ncbi:MAG: EAL domain-containing protein [Yoonia sp.]|nr:EAL domain-containing protein [Yoonia sp.]
MNMRPALTSPNLLVSVLDELDTPTVLVDIAGNITFANHALLKRLPPNHACKTGAPFAAISKGQPPRGSHRSQHTVTAGVQPIAGILQPLFDADKTQIGHVFFALPPFMQTWTDLNDLLNREMRWETAIDSAEQAVWDTWTPEGSHYISDTWRKIRGLSDDDHTINGSNWLDRVHPADLPGLLQHHGDQDSGITDSVNYQYRFQGGDGDWVWIQSRGRVVARDGDGEPERVIGTDTNITAFKDIEERMHAQTERLKLAMEVSGIGLWHFDLVKETVHWDDAMLGLYGITDGVNVRPQREWLQWLHPEDFDRMLAYANDRLAKKASFLQEFRILRADGKIRYLRSKATYLDDHNGSGPSVLGVNIDITDDVEKSIALEAARATMEHESRHDPLTGLANRRKLDEIHAAIVDAAAAKSMVPAFAVLHLDLDRFKEINDTFGHPAGDAVLIHAGTMIRDVIRDKGLVARVGGDEFVVLIEGTQTADMLNDIADQLISAAQTPCIFEGQTCAFGMSIGMASHDPGQSNTETAFMAADLALYQAKQDGRNRARHFEVQMRDDAIARRLSHHDIASGLKDNEFFNAYQPQFCAKSRKIIGVEALVRWQSRHRGLVMPDSFLPTAEANGFVGQIDAQVLETALADQVVWENHTDCVPRVSVNISSPRLHDPMLGKSLKALNIPVDKVCFELLETTFLESDAESVVNNLKMLRASGIDIEIDDFGSGHASIVGFLKIAPKRLKIDRALVTPIVKSKAQRKIVAAIVEIAKLSGAEVIAEGIETEAHAKIATAIGCDILQGYGLARPMSQAAFCELLEAQAR